MSSYCYLPSRTTDESQITKINSKRQIKSLCIVSWSFFQRQMAACKMLGFKLYVTQGVSDAVHHQLPGPGTERQVGLHTGKTDLASGWMGWCGALQITSSCSKSARWDILADKDISLICFWTNYQICSFIYVKYDSFRWQPFPAQGQFQPQCVIQIS